MSPALRFPDLASLRTALAEELIPKEQQTRPIRWAPDGDGVLIQGQSAPDTATLEHLGGLGVTVVDQRPQREGLCWAQALPLRKVAPASRGWFLISSLDRVAIQAFIRDALRLGSSTLLLRYGEPHAVRIYDPPTFLILRAKESEEFAVFHQREDGNWQAVGWDHPLATIRVEGADGIRFTVDQSWAPVPKEGWLDLNESVTIEVDQTEPCIGQQPENKIPIPVQLVPHHARTSPRLWFLPIRQQPSFERWTASLSQQQLQGLRFGILGSGDETHIALWADHHLEPPGDPVAYAPVDDHSAIYLPVNTTISPPLSTEQLAGAVDQQGQEILWLEPGDERARVSRAPTAAFYPLADWVSYIIEQEQQALQTWLKGIDPLLTPSLTTDPLPEESKPLQEPARESVAAPTPASPAPPKPREDSLGPSRPVSVESTPAQVDPTGAHLAQSAPISWEALQAAEVKLRLQPTQAHLWTQLAALQAGAGMEQAATRSLGRAWWSLAPTQLRQAASEWLAGLAAEAPTRSWSAILAHQASDEADAWLLAHRNALDVRSVWLARRALLEAGRCDQLALQEEKDYLLGRIRHGLSPVVDLPPLLLDSTGSLRPQIERRRALESLAEYFESSSRTPHPAETAPQHTTGLIQLIVGYGYAALGDQAGAQRHIRQAEHILEEAPQPLVTLLRQSYLERIGLALAGRSSAVPLSTPTELDEALSPIETYHYGQWLDTSLLLEPLQSINPDQRWQNARDNHATDEGRIAQMIGATPHLNRIIGAAQGEAIEALQQVLNGLDGTASLGLLARAYACAGAWGRSPLAEQALTTLREGVAGAEAQAIAQLARELPPLLRFGGGPEAAELLAQFSKSSACTQLYVEASLAAIGSPNRALSLAKEALGLLQTELPISERLDWIRAISEAAREEEPETASPLWTTLSAQLPLMNDNRISNAYYSAAALEFTECLVLAITGSGPSTNPSLLHAEESEIRRQIDQDTRMTP